MSRSSAFRSHRLATRFCWPLTLALAVLWSGCSSSDSGPATTDAGNPISSGADAPPASTPIAGDPIEPGTGDVGNPGPLGPRIADVGIEVGTHPGMEGALFSADDFPQREIITVLAPDAIPAITDPVMLDKDQVGYVSDNDLVFGVVIDGDARAYPHNIGWWHEIVNDVVGGRPLCITFCPLTGTGLVFDGTDIDGNRLELGVSGLLYNTNLVMYNRNSPRSLYPQVFSTAVAGDRLGHTLDLMPVVETTWHAWKQMYPQTKVMAKGTYSSSRYSQYPYGDYRENDANMLFPLRPTLSANPNGQTQAYGIKDRVLGLRVDGDAIAFPFDEMDHQQIINTTVGGLEVAIAWDSSTRMAIPFARRAGEQSLTFKIVNKGFPFSMRDRETGTLWDIRGLAVEGELAGERLIQIPAHNAMWFAWVTFWPNTEVWAP